MLCFHRSHLVILCLLGCEMWFRLKTWRLVTRSKSFLLSWADFMWWITGGKSAGGLLLLWLQRTQRFTQRYYSETDLFIFFLHILSVKFHLQKIILLISTDLNCFNSSDITLISTLNSTKLHIINITWIKTIFIE